MEPKPGLIERVIQFLYAIGLPPMRILQGLIFFLVAGAIFGALFVFDTSSLFKSTEKKTPEDDKLIEYVAKPDLAPEELTLEEQIEEIYYFKQGTGVNYVVAIGNIEQQRAKIHELLSREDLSDEQKQKLQFTLLRHGQSLLQRNYQARALEAAEVDEFNTFARSFIGGEDEKLDDFAKFAICDAETMLLRRRPSEENAQRLSQALVETKSSFLNNENRARDLFVKLLDARSIHPGKPHIENAINDFGKLLAGSEEESVAALASKVSDFSRFAPFEIVTLERRIRLKVDGSLQDLDDALRLLGETPETNIATWKTLMRAYESSISIGQQTRVLQTGWGIVNDLVGKLPGSDPKKAPLEAILKKQLERSKKFGSVVDLKAGETVKGEPFAEVKRWQLIIFADRSQKSASTMLSLRRRQQEGLQLGQPIVAFENDYTAADRAQLDKVKIYQLASFETSKKLIEALSIDFFPYIALVDEQGTVVALDLSVEQAVRRMMDLN